MVAQLSDTLLDASLKQQEAVSRTRLLVAFSIPDKVREEIVKELPLYKNVVSDVLAQDTWYVILQQFGDGVAKGQAVERLCEPLPQAFVPVITLTHLGRGQGLSLWAWGMKTPVLEQIQASLGERSQSLGLSPARRRTLVAPYIHVADLELGQSQLAVVDSPLSITFASRSALVLESTLVDDAWEYEQVGTIYLGP